MLMYTPVILYMLEGFSYCLAFLLSLLRACMLRALCVVGFYVTLAAAAQSCDAQLPRHGVGVIHCASYSLSDIYYSMEFLFYQFIFGSSTMPSGIRALQALMKFVI